MFVIKPNEEQKQWLPKLRKSNLKCELCKEDFHGSEENDFDLEY